MTEKARKAHEAWLESNADTNDGVDPEKSYSRDCGPSEDVAQEAARVVVRLAMTDEEFALDNFFADSGLSFGD